MVSSLSSSRARLAPLATALTLTLAVTAAILVWPGGGPVPLLMASLSSTSAELLGTVGTALPLGYAFGAGMLAAVNPCGFALLPAYIGLYLGTNTQREMGRRPLAR